MKMMLVVVVALIVLLMRAFVKQRELCETIVAKQIHEFYRDHLDCPHEPLIIQFNHLYNYISEEIFIIYFISLPV